MKITDVTLTLFAWDDIPPTQYGQHSRFAGSSALGLLRIATDDGVEGHAFLGSASNSATTDGQGLITHLKPMLMGRNPLHREALVVDLWKSSGPVACAPSARSTWRCGTFWARRSASRSIACSAPIARRCRPMPAPPSRCARAYAEEAQSSRSTAGPPTRSIRRRAGRRTSRSARRCARRSATTPSCSTRPGPTITRRRCASVAPPRRWASTGTRTRWPTRTSTIT